MILFVLLCLIVALYFTIAEACYERRWPSRTLPYLAGVVFLIVCASGFGQEYRVDVPLQTSGPNVPSSGGPLPQVLWVANATVAICAHPTSTYSACVASPITTYTDSSGAVACPSNKQLVQLPGNTCTASAGVTANVGFWYPGGLVDMYAQSVYGTFGPYTVNALGSGNFCPLTGCSINYTKLPLGPLNVQATTCGASGGGTIDDTAHLQACITAAKPYASNPGHTSIVYIPSGLYKVTAPLDATLAPFPHGGLIIRGDGPGVALAATPTTSNNTNIIDALGVAGPVFDFGGDGGGGIEDLSIITANGTYAGTSSTSAILVSQGASGFLEGAQRFTIKNVAIGATGDCVGCAAIAMPGVDEEVLENVYTGGGSVVLGWGLGKSTAVNSTFYNLAALLPNTNTTRVEIKDSDINAEFEPTIQFTGSQDNVMQFVYAAQIGTGVGGDAIEVTRPTGTGSVPQNAVHFYGIRTENQSSATGMVALMFGARSTSGRVDGNLCTDSSGYQIATEGTGSTIESQDWEIDCSASLHPLNITSGYVLTGDTIKFGTPPASLGTINAASVLFNDNFYFPGGTSFSSASVVAALPTSSQNVVVERSDNDYAVTAQNWASNSTGPITINGALGAWRLFNGSGGTDTLASTDFHVSYQTTTPTTVTLPAGGATGNHVYWIDNLATSGGAAITIQTPDSGRINGSPNAYTIPEPSGNTFSVWCAGTTNSPGQWLCTTYPQWKQGASNIKPDNTSGDLPVIQSDLYSIGDSGILATSVYRNCGTAAFTASTTSANASPGCGFTPAHCTATWVGATVAGGALGYTISGANVALTAATSNSSTAAVACSAN